MQSATAPTEDLTARARIRDAAIARFAESGVDGTSLRVIAEEADVSPALVIHHFGSKEGLRRACDEHVVATISGQKVAAMAQGPSMDVMSLLRESEGGPPVMRYLARTLVDGSPEVVSLVDSMAAAGVESITEGVRAGLLEPVDDPEQLASLLTVWSLGALVLHEHVERLLGGDITGSPEGRSPYVLAAITALRGIFTAEAHEQITRNLQDAEREGEGDDG